MKKQLLAWVALVAAMMAPASAADWEPAPGKYETLRDCRFVESGADDGDSFMVQRGQRAFLFRLYAVDTPESSMAYPHRVIEQAAHFGITPPQAVQVGLEAEKFTRRLLQAGAFTVQTCWQDAKGASRVKRSYAVITLSNGKDLAEELAAAGLARVYGFTPTTPGFSLAKLEGMERAAKSHHLGAYRLARATAPPKTAPTAGKVNLNTATEQQLEALPGIGPSFAKKLIASRPYQKVADIQRVPGIGPKTLAKLAPYATVTGP